LFFWGRYIGIIDFKNIISPVYCKIKMEKVASEKYRMLQLEIP
jgi:hypothetical protein